MSLWRIKGEGEIAKETKENKSVQKGRMKSQTIWASQKASENPVLRKKEMGQTAIRSVKMRANN